MLFFLNTTFNLLARNKSNVLYSLSSTISLKKVLDVAILFLFLFDYYTLSLLFTFKTFFYMFEFLMLFSILFLCTAIAFKINIWVIKRLSLFLAIFIFLVSLLFLVFIQSYGITDYDWIGFSNFSNMYYYFRRDHYFTFISSILVQTIISDKFFFYIDGVSVFFILLTTFLVPICILVSWYSSVEKVRFFLLMLFILEFALVNSFTTSNLFVFFIFFEVILFPMFFIIGIWGSRDRKIHAVFQFLLYTLIGSVFLYVAIFYLWWGYNSVDYLVLKQTPLSFFDQNFLFWLLFISFSFKIPLFPVHIWLPEAHVEAPTFGSIILAGLLLKLGTYGIMRFVISLFPDAVSYFAPLVLVLVIIGIFYTSFSTTRQLDLKKIIAYSSIGHMGFVILGLFTTYIDGLSGSLYLMIGHGFISSALFMSIGFLYERYHTRNITDLRGLVRFMPLFGIFFLIYTLANVSFPGTFNFIAEIGVLLALVKSNLILAVCSVFSIIFIMVYSFWLYNRIMYGNSFAILDRYEIIGKYMDLSLREFTLMSIFAFLIIFFGFFPSIILTLFVPYCDYMLLPYDAIHRGGFIFVL